MSATNEARGHPASFRDRDGFLYERDGVLYRQVNHAYAAHYDRLMQSGLYDRLVSEGALIAHRELSQPGLVPDLAYKVLEPVRVEFVSYPYEWCFSQLKDAALATLETLSRALDHGLTLKDASAYNIQFKSGRPVLIDSLSFMKYQEGQPWIGYRQFCQHFLAPLALMAHTDIRLGQLLRVHLDGIPLDLASRLLPWRTHLNPGLQVHLHLHASAQRRVGSSRASLGRGRKGVSRLGLRGLIDSLQRTVKSLSWEPDQSDWARYAGFHNYSEVAMEQKLQAAGRFLDEDRPSSLWDLGANTGRFSRLASGRGVATLAFDFDPGAVELNYRQTRQTQDPKLLPLLLDLTNPSPSQGWAHLERESLVDRGPADGLFGLALIHHLAISNNVPLASLAEFLTRLAKSLLIEFVPKADPQVQKLLAGRTDIFDDYSTSGFESAFQAKHVIRERMPVGDSGRILYWLESRG
jgi:ribosomal protein L11 methylase PrmA